VTPSCAFTTRSPCASTGIPGITSAGAVSLLPLSGLLNTMDLAFPGRPVPSPDKFRRRTSGSRAPATSTAAGIRVVAGREFTVHDTDTGRPVALVSRTLAARHWPAEEAVGRTLRIGVPGSPAFEVVGVVGDARQFTLDGTPTADLYLPLHQIPASQAPALAARTYWVVRTQGDPRALTPAIRQAVHSVDPDVRHLERPSSGRRRVGVARGASPERAACSKSSVRPPSSSSRPGIYAMAAFSASARKRELAIRAAFGATHGDLARRMLRDELRPILAGVAIGLAASLLVARLLDGMCTTSVCSIRRPTRRWLPAHRRIDLASYLPARRAGRVDPVELLRS
jgi:putative ABC transport system permease protein